MYLDTIEMAASWSMGRPFSIDTNLFDKVNCTLMSYHIIVFD
jgi:hypothetical protein